MNLKLVSEQMPSLAYNDSLFDYALGNAFWLDKQSNFLDANKNELDWCGVADLDTIKGRGAKDFTSIQKTEIYIRNDQEVMNSQKGMVVIEPSYDNKKNQFLTYKAPLLTSQGKIIGVFGVGYDLEHLVASNSIL